MMTAKRILLAALLAAPPIPAGAQESPLSVEPPALSLLERQEQIKAESESRIQREILDPVLGKEKASVFVDAEIDVKASRKQNLRGGAGVAEKFKSKGDENSAIQTQFILPGVPKPKNLSEEKPTRPTAQQGQSAQQVRTEQEEVFSQQVVMKKFHVTVIHEASIAPAKIEEVRKLIVDAMSRYKLEPDNVFFRKANHFVPEKNWWDDLKDPKVYLPLLYALLLLLLLSFLFGPFARFLRRYTEALMAKPAAEVNVESNIEPPDEDGRGKGAGEEETRSAIDMMIGRKPPEEPPPPPEEPAPEEEVPLEEVEEMEKHDPFDYINDENVQRLANLFQLRNEEPWLVATVISYLKPEYQRRVLMALPAELQAKTALEALKVRQITKEQIDAIDADIKENIDFVVGGVERLISMLEEADPATRQNILDSLQNEKPVVYEYVRKAILLFDDISSFADREMQVIVRELKTESMAKALQGAAPEVVNKFFKNMSAGAASLLKESMEYQKGMTGAQIETERAAIMEQIKALAKAGKVKLQAGGADLGGFRQEVASESARRSAAAALKAAQQAASSPAAPAAAPAPAPMPKKNPAEARKYYDAGVQYHMAGSLDEAVKYFRQALELDPELWDAYQYLGQGLYQMGRQSESVIYYEKYLQHNPDPELKAWVDGMKSHMGA